MCGVIGLIYERPRADLGRIAGELLKTLEYRGYDSTGAAIQGDGETVQLAKGVGAPSVMADKLGITQMSGQILCGQVRWATFGVVNAVNAQPHEVKCRAHLYGAHNGNVTNCDELKEWLQTEGHEVRSDNDGEMVVHAIEHGFARELAALSSAQRTETAPRRCAMRAAIAEVTARLEGSFSAVVVDPTSRVVWAIKSGSSLYCGFGHDEDGGSFQIASSDLSSVLKLTRVVVPLVEGEFVEMDGQDWQVYGIRRQGDARSAAPLAREPVRSRLRSSDIALVPPFETFMDQEIAAQEATVRDVISSFLGGDAFGRAVEPAFDSLASAQMARIRSRLDTLRDQIDDEALAAHLHALVDTAACQALLQAVPASLRDAESGGDDPLLGEHLVSSERGFLADLLPMARDRADRFGVRLMDTLLARDDQRDFAEATGGFVRMCLDTIANGGRIYVICCGTSLHAAKAAAVFFNEIARCDLVTVLPGIFRGQYANSLNDGDLVIAVSQSGETKDLIDVLNGIIASGLRVGRVALVNNVNSTLAQEKSDLVIPLRCGPEIAVPATKSFMNQVAVFYGLALLLARGRSASGRLPPEVATRMNAVVEQRWTRLHELPDLLLATFTSTEAEIEAAAQMLYLRPSIHLLSTRTAAIAREGALKIREVVLNHAEGFEGSEFKHGPNTILGKNTLFGPQQVNRLMTATGQALDRLLELAEANDLPMAAVRRLCQALTDSVFSPDTTFSLDAMETELLDKALDHDALLDALYEDYPLIYITGPEERDVLLTVSQINTHKIRGATTVVIAEEHPALRAAAEKSPADNPSYKSVYITLPRTNDTLMTVFSATLVLQRMALRMSLLKAAWLNRVGFKEHGVHPDVPKNVSKSITVD